MGLDSFADQVELLESPEIGDEDQRSSRPKSMSTWFPWRRPMLIAASAACGGAALMLAARCMGAASAEQAESPEQQIVQLGASRTCCSWNHVDCGHGGKYCQTDAAACAKCKGAWGTFQDVCQLGHPPAPPLQDIWPYHGKKDLKIKVMSYNLEWWATGGGAAPQVIKASSLDMPYDFMGFQECNDPWHVLWMGNMQNKFQAAHVNRGPAVDICMVWRNATWMHLSGGDRKVAMDAKYGGRYAMWGRFQHIKTKEIVFFMNHHGPLPLNSGGSWGGPSVASALLSLIREQAKPGDAVVLVGDFNADGGSLTVRQLECKLSHVAWGNKYNGVDNVFANVAFRHIAHGHGKTLYGGNSDHNALNVVIDLGVRPDGGENANGQAASTTPLSMPRARVHA